MSNPLCGAGRWRRLKVQGRYDSVIFKRMVNKSFN